MENQMKYKVVVLDDYDQVRRLIVENLRFRGVEAHGYNDAQRLLSEIFDAGSPPEELPDLVVVDLELEPGKMQGAQFINELISRDVPSEILVISGYLIDGPEALRLGAGAGMPKPFDNFFDSIRRMEVLAETGRRRRVHRLASEKGCGSIDPDRLQRPVFLSYSNLDKALATGLRKYLEAKMIPVWYAPDTIRVGDEFRERIKNGIDHADVFVPLITDHYLGSEFCVAEMGRFYQKLESCSDHQILILPVLSDLSIDPMTSGILRPIVDTYQYLDISRRFVDGLTVLSARIQSFLAQRRPAGRDHTESGNTPGSEPLRVA